MEDPRGLPVQRQVGDQNGATPLATETHSTAAPNCHNLSLAALANLTPISPEKRLLNAYYITPRCPVPQRILRRELHSLQVEVIHRGAHRR